MSATPYPAPTPENCVQRFDCRGYDEMFMQQRENGDWVKYDDYERLERERDTLANRKAGMEMVNDAAPTPETDEYCKTFLSCCGDAPWFEFCRRLERERNFAQSEIRRKDNSWRQQLTNVCTERDALCAELEKERLQVVYWKERHEIEEGEMIHFRKENDALRAELKLWKDNAFTYDKARMKAEERLAALREADSIRVYRDGNSWCAVHGDFINLQESEAGFGDTPIEACANLVMRSLPAGPKEVAV